MAMKDLKLRIYPNSEQERRLPLNFGCTRFVWNALPATAILTDAMKTTPKSL